LDWAPRNLCQEEQVIVAQGNLSLFWGEGEGGSDYTGVFFGRGKAVDYQKDISCAFFDGNEDWLNSCWF